MSAKVSERLFRSDAFRPAVSFPDGSAISRRNLLLAGFCLCCLPRSGFAAEQAGIEEISSGVFMRRGPHAEASPDNHNGIANIGFIIGEDSVLVTDPGGSLADGRWLRAEIRKRTERPIRHVVMSHVHPDHAFGAAAFDEDEPNIIGHMGLSAALQTRGDFYRERLVEVLGEQEVGRIVLPTQEVGTEGAEIDLGRRVLRFTAHQTAHTTCDLTMIDANSDLLFAGDLLFVERIPSLDGSLLGWIDELAALRSLDVTKAVPGHGPVMVDLGSAIPPLERYLVTLRDETRSAIAKSMAIDEAAETVGLSERQNWALFDDYNSRNVIQAYKELEWE
jgi:quinoprotein relay system zinc metallohydrolase 2